MADAAHRWKDAEGDARAATRNAPLQSRAPTAPSPPPDAGATAARSRAEAWALAALAGLLLVAHGVLAAWLLAHPPSLASNDALHFARALTRFSILDFSPHFPGYPAFVGLGRLMGLLVPEPVAALQATTILLALLLPFACAYAAWRMTGRVRAALGADLLALTCPLVPGLALSGLSDGAGMVFFLLFLAFMAERAGAPARPLFAGLALAVAAAARPSYGPMYAAAAAVLLLLAPRRMGPAALVAGAGAAAALAFLLAREGMLYFAEGARFLQGHTQVWGNTLVSGHARLGWGEALMATPLLAASLLLPAGLALWDMARERVGAPARRATQAAFLVMALFTIAMQNAEHLRHLAPLALLCGLLLATRPAVGRRLGQGPVVLAVAVLQVAALARGTAPDPALPAPLAAAGARIAALAPGGLVLAEDGVACLRATLTGQRVVDAMDPSAIPATPAAEAGPMLRLATRPRPGATPVARFPGRVPGEEELLLYVIPSTAPDGAG